MYTDRDFLTPTSLPIPRGATNNYWYYASQSDTVLVFVHGIFSDSRSCWLHSDPAETDDIFWPDLVRTDDRFGRPAIFMGGYGTALAAGSYELRDCAQELLTGIETTSLDGTPPVMSKPSIIFICHSTGGNVVRYLLTREHARFAGKAVGLALIASPSLGSGWASLLSGPILLLGNTLAGQLKSWNNTLGDLDDRFMQLVKDGTIDGLFGREACEHKMILRGWLAGPLKKFVPAKLKLVGLRDMGRYFGSPTVLYDTDHFSSVKPDTPHHVSHTFLAHFMSDFYDFISDRERVKEIQVTEPVHGSAVDINSRIMVVKRVNFDIAPVVAIRPTHVYNKYWIVNGTWDRNSKYVWSIDARFGERDEIGKNFEIRAFDAPGTPPRRYNNPVDAWPSGIGSEQVIVSRASPRRSALTHGREALRVRRASRARQASADQRSRRMIVALGIAIGIYYICLFRFHGVSVRFTSGARPAAAEEGQGRRTHPGGNVSDAGLITGPAPETSDMRHAPSPSISASVTQKDSEMQSLKDELARTKQAIAAIADKQQPRRITSAQSDKFTEITKNNVKPSVMVRLVTEDREPSIFAADVVGMLKRGGYQASSQTVITHGISPQIGVVVGGKDGEQATNGLAELRDALKVIGVSAGAKLRSSSMMDKELPTGCVIISIGAKE